MTPPTVGIVGGGILGMTAALRLAEAGVQVAVYERAPDLGGLVGLLRLRGPRGRPLLPRQPSDRRPRARARRGARPQGQVPLPAHEGGLLRRRTAVLDDLAEGVPDLPAAQAVGADAARRVRRALPADRAITTSSTGRRSWNGSAASVAAASSRSSGSRCSTPSSTGTTTISPRPTSGPARSGCPRRGTRAAREIMGWLEGGYTTLIDALERRIRELGGEFHTGDAGRSDRRGGGRGDGPRRRGPLPAVRPRALHARSAAGRARCFPRS